MFRVRPLIVLLVLVAASVSGLVPLLEEPSPESPDSDLPGCTGDPVVTDVLWVPPGETLEYDDDTWIVASAVVVAGVLRTADAGPGQDAPSLCIQTSALVVGPSGVICTGDGASAVDAFGAGEVSGLDGTRGGDLYLLGSAVPSSPISFLLVQEGGRICTGAGGDGGSALAVEPCSEYCEETVESCMALYSTFDAGFDGTFLWALDTFTPCAAVLPTCQVRSPGAEPQCSTATPSCAEILGAGVPDWSDIEDFLEVGPLPRCNLADPHASVCLLPDDALCEVDFSECANFVGEISGIFIPGIAIPSGGCSDMSAPSCSQIIEVIESGLLTFLDPAHRDCISTMQTSAARDPCNPPLLGDWEKFDYCDIDIDVCQPVPGVWKDVIDVCNIKIPPCSELIAMIGRGIPGHWTTSAGSSDCIPPICKQRITDCLPRCDYYYQTSSTSSTRRDCIPPICEPEVYWTASASSGSPGRGGGDECIPPICSVFDNFVAASAGSGGSAGSLWMGIGGGLTPMWNLASGSIALGRGGDGGSALAVGDRLGKRSAQGGSGGASVLMLDGVGSDEEFPEDLMDWLLSNLFTVGASQGGDGGGASVLNIDDCGLELPCGLLQGPLDVNAELAKLVNCIWVAPACNPDPDPQTSSHLFGCKGEDARVESGDYHGPPGQGIAGDDGEAGEDAVGCSAGTGFSCGANAGCTGAQNASRGQGPGDLTDPEDGHWSEAIANKGGWGLLRGGDGGFAYVHGSSGGHGSTGGKGGDGDHYQGLFCHDYRPPAAGGDGQKGGDSGTGAAYGGHGGDSRYQGGNGGNSGGRKGTPGNGGNGGDGGYVAWAHEAACAGFPAIRPVDHGVEAWVCSDGWASYQDWGFYGCGGAHGTYKGIEQYPGSGGAGLIRGADGLPTELEDDLGNPLKGSNGNGKDRSCPQFPGLGLGI